MAITTVGMDGALGILDATVYVGVHTGVPGADGSTNELGTRYAITFGAATTDGTGRQRANTNEITWTTPGAATYQAYSIWDAATAGNCRWVIDFTTNRTLLATDDLRAAVGAIIAKIAPSA
jgi:hypothetical protein